MRLHDQDALLLPVWDAEIFEWQFSRPVSGHGSVHFAETAILSSAYLADRLDARGALGICTRDLSVDGLVLCTAGRCPRDTAAGRGNRSRV